MSSNEPKPLPVMNSFRTIVSYARTEDDWCVDCAKPSVLVGPTVVVTLNGVKPEGTVRFCRECDKREWFDAKGVLIPNVGKCDNPAPTKKKVNDAEDC